MARRRQRLLILLVLLIGAGVAAYAAAPALLGAFLTHRFGDDVGIRALEIESIGPRQTRVSVVRLNNKQMRLEAQQADIRYRLWPFEVQGVDVARAELDIRGPAGGDDAGAAPPVPPSFPLRVDRLALRVATPWGAVSVPAMSLSSGPGGAGGLQAGLRSDGFEMSLSNPAAGAHLIGLRDASGNELLSVSAETGGGFPVRLNGWIETGDAAAWLPRSGLLPEGLADALAPYDVDDTRVELEGETRVDGGLTLRLGGAIGVRDRREPGGGRLFQAMRIEAEPGYTVSRGGEGWSGSGKAAFRFSPEAGTTLSGRDPSWQWTGGGLSLTAQAVKLVEAGIGADSIEASIPALTAGLLEGELSISGVTTSWWPDALAHYGVSGRWSWRNGAFQAEGNAAGDALPDLIWTVERDEGGGNAEVTTEAALASLVPSLAVYTRSLARDLEVLGGELAGRYAVEWTPAGQKTALRLTAGSVDANLDEMEIRGLSATLTNQGTAVDRLELAVSAPALQLAAGTVAEDLALDLRLATPKLHVDRARMNLFGGEIAVRPASFNLNDDSFELLADITGLSLEKVMSLLELETTELTGNVAGPVRVVYHKDRGIELNEGDLHSVEPGVLRFRLDGSSDVASELDNIAIRALENFQYDELNASVLYKPDGEYRISARIVGRNPDVLDGHPIALNPTIEGRLPALFRAFFITGDFSRAIIERLRKEQSPSTPGETSTFDQD